MKINTIISALTAISVIVSIAISVVPEGKIKKSVKLVCGIAFLAVILGTVKKLDFKDFSYEIKKQAVESEKLLSDITEVNDSLNRTIIEEKSESYILDKAQNLGLTMTKVSVFAKWSTDGFWYPYAASLISDCSDEQKEKMEFLLSSELGITKENIQWSSGNA